MVETLYKIVDKCEQAFTKIKSEAVYKLALTAMDMTVAKDIAIIYHK